MAPAKPLIVLLLCAAGCLAWADETSPAGLWRGESKCLTDAPACHDEQVVYTIKAVPNRPDQFLIRADKIVDGRTITMGEGPWAWDEKKQTLTFDQKERVWLMTLSGDRMDATLTLADGTLFRRMRLTRDQAPK